MKRNTAIIAFIFLFQFAFGQSELPAKYSSLITEPTLKKDLTIIASPEMEGRETGMPGQRKAAAYIESRMKEIGLKPVSKLKGHRQNFPLLKDSLIESLLTIEDKKANYGEDFISPVSQNENKKISASSIVFAGYGISDKKYDDYAGLNVKGKIVLIVLGEPKENGNVIITGTNKGSEWTFPGLSKKAELAKKLGAKGLLVLSISQEKFSDKTIEYSRRTNMYFPDESGEPKVNFVNLSHAFAKSVFSEEIIDPILKMAREFKPFSKENYFERKLKTTFNFKKTGTVTEACNVIGVLEGSDKKDEFVFVTGHYDHLGMHDGKIFHGADDDGSGTVAVLNLAQAFATAKAEGHGPRRTMVFMTVSGEEKGLWGSEYYSDHPVFPLEKTTVDLNIDMIGRIDTQRDKPDTLNYVYVIGHDKISSELQGINEGANNNSSGLTLDYRFDDPNDPNRIFFRSDHYNFARKGVPILFFYDGMLLSDYHKPTDTVDKINWELYKKRATMIFHTAWEIANRNQLIKRDLPLPSLTR